MMFDKMREAGLAGVTPEILRKRIKQINDSNTDTGKRKLSHDDAIKLLGISLYDPAVAPEISEAMKRAIPQMEHGCATADSDFNKANNPMLQGALNTMGSHTLDNIKFSQEIAASDNDKELDEAVQRMSAKIFTRLEKQFGIVSQVSPQEAKLAVEKMHGVFKEVAKKTKTILKDNPDIKRALFKLPNIDELGRLDANDACKAISGHGVGVMKM